MPRNKNDLERAVIKAAREFIGEADEDELLYLQLVLRHAVRDLQEFEEVQEQLGRLLSERSNGPITSVPLLRTP